MPDRIGIMAGLGVFLALATTPLWLGADSAELLLTLPPAATRCVEAPEVMRREHGVLLAHWRDAVVREGRRDDVTGDGRAVAMSLTGTCLGCHDRPTEFCARCHDWVGVEPDCFSCHLQPTERPR